MLTLPRVPLALLDDAALIADLPYGPEVLFFDELTEIDAEKSLIRCRMPTDVPMPIVSAQRNHPVRHPRHVAGAVMVHATGMMGFLHAYYLLGLRHHEGWIGYGTHIHKVVFRKLVQPGTPIDATCIATKKRLGRTRHMIRYSFEFRHEGAVCYEGDQTAVWMRVDESNPPAGFDVGGAGASAAEGEGNAR
jgi:3-hydroxymyristoyl/3-hydroxydecanoyl-(acyl carrier protein) dehydratase